MAVDDLILTVSVGVDDALQQLCPGPRRAHGPQPVLADSAVITMELVGGWLGFDPDTQLLWYFRQHHAGAFPNVAQGCRTTFARQAANRWRGKQRLHQPLVHELAPAAAIWLIASVPS